MPGGTSTNLAAQDGVFTVSGVHAERGERFESMAVELQQDVYRHQTADHPGLIKITLPITQAIDLLHLCSDLGVRESTLFPRYEGVAREINDSAYANFRMQEPRRRSEVTKPATERCP